jgi:hypothetical protein
VVAVLVATVVGELARRKPALPRRSTSRSTWCRTPRPGPCCGPRGWTASVAGTGDPEPRPAAADRARRRDLPPREPGDRRDRAGALTRRRGGRASSTTSVVVLRAPRGAVLALSPLVVVVLDVSTGGSCRCCCCRSPAVATAAMSLEREERSLPTTSPGSPTARTSRSCSRARARRSAPARWDERVPARPRPLQGGQRHARARHRRRAAAAVADRLRAPRPRRRPSPGSAATSSCCCSTSTPGEEAARGRRPGRRAAPRALRGRRRPLEVELSSGVAMLPRPRHRPRDAAAARRRAMYDAKEAARWTVVFTDELDRPHRSARAARRPPPRHRRGRARAALPAAGRARRRRRRSASRRSSGGATRARAPAARTLPAAARAHRRDAAADRRRSSSSSLAQLAEWGEPRGCACRWRSTPRCTTSPTVGSPTGSSRARAPRARPVAPVDRDHRAGPRGRSQPGPATPGGAPRRRHRAVSLDDFGTGHASLTRLKRLPVSEVKIDRQFVRPRGRPEDRAIVRSVVELAHAIGLRCVAEGVETARQWERSPSSAATRSRAGTWRAAMPAAEARRGCAPGHGPAPRPPTRTGSGPWGASDPPAPEQEAPVALSDRRGPSRRAARPPRADRRRGRGARAPAVGRSSATPSRSARSPPTTSSRPPTRSR